MITYSGLVLPDDPVEMAFVHVKLDDIAMHLSRINRWAGATRVPFSVAEHSLHTAEAALSRGGGARMALVALLHDAHEAYLGDLISPVKARLGPIVKVWERHIDRCIYTCLGIDEPTQEEAQLCEQLDRICRRIEARALLHPCVYRRLYPQDLTDEWPEPKLYYGEASREFIERFEDLRDECRATAAAGAGCGRCW